MTVVLLTLFIGWVVDQLLFAWRYPRRPHRE